MQKLQSVHTQVNAKPRFMHVSVAPTPQARRC